MNKIPIKMIEGEYTTDILDCANNGCGFCDNGKCRASGTYCFGYLDPDWEV